ncbi:MAG TPA: ABC transporter substrate-binding protein [Candidatus Udaeobacter sp.]|jgi:ABC-type nitrate/sulfonate/bicarbonate transport system substrate-binding protein|nr:ABC transporter substrate-binding protein [Candidatus Udaeobacter sp.]
MARFAFAILTIFFIAAPARAADVEVPRPRGNLEIKLGHPSTISLYDTPAIMTRERLNSQGWNVSSVEFTRTDLNVQALAQGTIQLANSQIMDPVRAIQKGAKLFFLMENNGGEFVMIAKNEIKDCKDIDGKKFAIHGEAATTSLAIKLWLLNNCKIKPNIMVIPGGENRIVALQNNQIDATLVQLGDWLNLDSQAPGRYHIIKTGNLFNISGASFWANGEWLRKNEEVATAYIAELLKTFRMVHANPKVLEPVVAKHLPDMPKHIIAPAIKAYLEVVRAWPQNGGDTSILDDTVKFFTDSGELKSAVNTKELVEPKILANALSKLGKVPGAR